MQRIGTATLLSASGAAAYGLALVALDALIAYRYGLGSQAAVFQAAFQVPAALINIISGGAILGALIPLVSRSLRQSDPSGTSDLLSGVAGFILALQSLVVLAMVAAVPLVAQGVASGFSAELKADTATVLRWILPLLVLNGLASIGISTLLAARRVVLANLAPALMPLAGMLTWPFWDEHGALWIAWGCLAGVALQVIVLTIGLRRDRLRFLPPAWPRGEAVRFFMRSFAATGLAHAALSAVLLVNTALAGSISGRELAAFGYGSRLVLLALAFLTSLINNVGLPYLSELAQQADREMFRRRLLHIIRLAGAAGFVLAFTWLAAAGWIVDLIYARGSFNAADVATVANVQRFFVLQAPFSLAGVVCWRALNVSGEWRPLVLASLAALVIDVAAATALAPSYASAGIAGAHTLGMAAWSAVLLFAIHQRYPRA
ncbi:MAG: lipid II flippase MurJ [Pseudomonadota bacterium]|nr:lipid II flippase MurJ [Pseudomonadota bacterium]